MKKIMKILIALIITFIFLNDVEASIKTSFADCFVGVNINYQNQINFTSIEGDDLLDSTAERTYFKLSYQTLIDDDCNSQTEVVEKKENKILYCADGNKSSPANDIANGAVPKDKIPFKVCEILKNNSRKITYVYEHGYGTYQKDYNPTQYLTGDYKKDYYITQSAVWYFTKPKEWMNNFDFSKGTYNNVNNEISQKISKLILDAETASAGASISIESKNDNLTLSSDSKYYISSQIKLNAKFINSKINIITSGIDGAFVTTDQNATSGSTSFENESIVYVKVPVDKIGSSNFVTLSASATTVIDDGEVIQCGRGENSNYQPVIMYYPHTSNTTATKKLSINSYTVNITKKDITNSKEIEGATLTIKNTNGTEVETWVSEKKAKTIYLKPGTYILEETIAPAGYIKSANKIEFIVNENGKVLVDGKEVSELTITNEPIKITISKRSITGSDELKGAKLKITDKSGNIVNDISGNKLEWISTDKPISFQLKQGEYILSETIAPDGYELSETTIEFTIDESGKILIDEKTIKNNLIIFKNTPEPEQVPTGNTIIYVAGTLCLLSLVIAVYFIIKRKEL